MNNMTVRNGGQIFSTNTNISIDKYIILYYNIYISKGTMNGGANDGEFRRDQIHAPWKAVYG